MPNNYFRFKQFTIEQDACSMKVCTDACLFGAYASNKFSNKKYQIKNCLDIGTGTGLLSLMYAQKNTDVVIDAVEIENNAFIQASENFSNSGWKNRLYIFNTDIKIFRPEKKYELIISNPPFYENELLSGEKNKNIAKHDAGLTLEVLIAVVKKHLVNLGYFAILLPHHRVQYFEGLAKENGLFLQEKLLIRQTPSHDFFRGVLFFSNHQSEIKTNEITVKKNNGDYSEEFIYLLKDYYLKL